MGLKLLASAPFDCFQVYSPGREADFFCFEPVNHIADAFNHIALNAPGSAALVTPGQEVRGAIRFTAKV